MNGAQAIVLEERSKGGCAALDPRIRLVAALGFALVVASLQSALPLGAALFVGTVSVLSGRSDLRGLPRRLLHVEGFLVLLLLTLPFTITGTMVVQVFGLEASREGIERAFAIIMRVNAVVLVAFALLASMGVVRIAAAMAGIGLPSRIAHMMLLTVRYISVFQEEYARLERAMRARGFVAGSSIHSWRSLANLIGMLVLRSLDRAERVTRAMKCRGFAGAFPPFEQGRLAVGDLLFLSGWASMLSVLLWLEYGR